MWYVYGEFVSGIGMPIVCGQVFADGMKTFSFQCAFILICALILGQIYLFFFNGSNAQLPFKCNVKNESTYRKIPNK